MPAIQGVNPGRGARQESGSQFLAACLAASAVIWLVDGKAIRAF